jgi:predicted NBD/HSP70 family sugar kinase
MDLPAKRDARPLNPAAPGEGAAGGRARRLRPRGSNQVGMRQFNERVVLQTLRLHGSLAKADLARFTHLSAQTIAMIVARLEKDDLIRYGEPVRGRVGQPAVPISLNPEGAYSIGVSIGRRMLSTLLIDLTGGVVYRHVDLYPYPDPSALFTSIAEHLDLVRDRLGARRARKLVGVGVAAPLLLGGWNRLLGVAPERVEPWNQVDLLATVQNLTRLPVHFAKDTNAACIAEMVTGRGRELKSFLYLFVDTFIGGGVVLDSHLHAGQHANAGAIGSVPVVSAGSGRDRTAEQLLGLASLWNLERLFERNGIDPLAAYDVRALDPEALVHTRAWAVETAHAMAMGIASGVAWLDIDAVVIDGSFDRQLLAMLLQELELALARHEWEGLWRPALLAGTIGTDARALGGAILPMHSAFGPDRELFLKPQDGA